MKALPPIALVSTAAARPLDLDLEPLSRALARRGTPCEVLAWDNDNVDWRPFSAAIVRSTWNYVEHRDEFLRWSRSLPLPLWNPPAILRWNIDKHYLRDLGGSGAPIVPTAFLSPGQELPALTSARTVVKPTISAGARDTESYTPDQMALAREHVARLHALGRAVMVQPYQGRVDDDGETALVYFNGRFSHAIRKGAMLASARSGLVSGLFREEEISARDPTPREREVAERVLEAVPAELGGSQALLYARVDLVPGEDGEPLLLELELTEPSLFLGFSGGAAERFAEAILARLVRHG